MKRDTDLKKLCAFQFVARRIMPQAAVDFCVNTEEVGSEE